MSNLDPFNLMPRNHDESFDSRYGGQNGVSFWPIIAVIVLLVAAGLAISL